MGRKKHGREFKEQAVWLSQLGGNSVRQVADEVGVHPKMLYKVAP